MDRLAPTPERADAARAADWFATLQQRITAAFEALEDEALAAGAPALDDAPDGPGRFVETRWQRTAPDGRPLPEPGGGGAMRVMKGRLFEKVGVNWSCVWGTFDPAFAAEVPGAAEDPRFLATGISLVAHMANPHVPAVHMNTRMILTTERWFGGGADLNPALPLEEDTRHFHQVLKAACDAHDPRFWPEWSAWCERYFWVPHRGRARGVGGIFYDRLAAPDEDSFERHFAVTREVGASFLDAFVPIVRRRMGKAWTADERRAQERYRGLYAEFNLLHDRGTRFGLKTGGRIDAILMSLPPRARWD